MRIFSILFFLIILSSTSKSQALKQNVYASAGGYYVGNNLMLSWTIGEVIIDTYNSNLYALTQGFHQPSEVTTIVETDDVDFFNGFSPNGDGINDYWKIPVLYKNPVNRVTIINRWGSIVWKNDNYDNDKVKFEGKNMFNEDLPDGTYLYEILYGINFKKGWVFIKR